MLPRAPIQRAAILEWEPATRRFRDLTRSRDLTEAAEEEKEGNLHFPQPFTTAKPSAATAPSC